MTSTCVDALCWARRFLPFACFLNAEEILQDLLLSLMSELPPLSLVIWCPSVQHYRKNVVVPLCDNKSQQVSSHNPLCIICSQVAETVAEAFPQEEESVRVALREKYNSLLQRLKQSNVLGMNNCLSFNFQQDALRSCFLPNKDLSCNETNFHF